MLPAAVLTVCSSISNHTDLLACRYIYDTFTTTSQAVIHPTWKFTAVLGDHKTRITFA